MNLDTDALVKKAALISKRANLVDIPEVPFHGLPTWAHQDLPSMRPQYADHSPIDMHPSFLGAMGKTISAPIRAGITSPVTSFFYGGKKFPGYSPGLQNRSGLSGIARSFGVMTSSPSQGWRMLKTEVNPWNTASSWNKAMTRQQSNAMTDFSGPRSQLRTWWNDPSTVFGQNKRLGQQDVANFDAGR